MQAGVSVLGGILGGLFGRKSGFSTSRGTTAIGKATTAYKQHQDVANAEHAKVVGITEDIEGIG